MPNVTFDEAGAIPLDELPLVVVDVETTGVRAWGGDRVTEIATVEVRGGDVGRTWSTLVYPERPIPHWITSLTGISDEMVRDAPPFRAVAERVRRRLAAGVFVGHNASFDWRFLDAELVRSTGDGAHVDARRLCTVRLARVFLRRLRRRSLDHVARFYGITISGRHRALGDAVATAHCLTRLLQAAQDAGIATLDDLETYADARRSRRRRRRSLLPSFFDPAHIA